MVLPQNEGLPRGSETGGQRYQYSAYIPTVIEERPSPKKKGRKQKFFISEQELTKYYGLSQPDAAQRLGVSVSTLKRRFYELHPDMRWPYNFQNEATRDVESGAVTDRPLSQGNDQARQSESDKRGTVRSKMSLSRIIHPYNSPNTVYIDDQTMKELQHAFHNNSDK